MANYTPENLAALQPDERSFDVRVGLDRGHLSFNRDRMMELFIESLVLQR